MKLLIIGSKGFIGSHCVTYFSQMGQEVFEADVVPSDSRNYTQLQVTATDFEHLMQQTPYDVCINASGSAHVGFSFEKPDTDFELNVLNVHKLLVAIRKYQPQCRFINFSSAAVYGNPERLPVAESCSTNPLSPYGFHKLQSEYLLREYNRFSGLFTCSLRVFSAYGPGLRKQLFWDLFQKSTTASHEVVLFGTGNESRDFIYITDLLQALNCIIQHAPFQGESYNIASGEETTIRDAATVFFKHLGTNRVPVFNNEVKTGDPLNWRADTTRLTALGFKPLTSLDAGLGLTATWMQNPS